MAQIFISYSRSDRRRTKKIATRLRRGFSVFFDADLRGGQKWWEVILKQIEECEVFVFFISPRSIRSPYCQAELDEAERLHKQVLPVLVDSRAHVPARLSHIQAVDMTGRITTDKYVNLITDIVHLLNSIPENFEEPRSPTPTPLPDVPDASRPWMRIASALVAITVVLFVAGYFLFMRGDNGDDSETPLPPTTDITNQIPPDTPITPSPPPTDPPSPTTPAPTPTTPSPTPTTPSPTTPPPTPTIPSPTPPPEMPPPIATALSGNITTNEQWTPYFDEFNGMEFALVPKGCFKMGSEDGYTDERPAHDQCIDEPYWIGRYEVTNEEYGKCWVFS